MAKRSQATSRRDPTETTGGAPGRDVSRGDARPGRPAPARDRAGRPATEPAVAGAAQILVQVCLRCGKEYTFEGDVPAELRCEKCGQHVFRSFFEPIGEDEVLEDHREMTERDLAPDDPAADITKGDILDLNNP